jgi:photosystem II stability/assembly factor-like uncharacterized protein
VSTIYIATGDALAAVYQQTGRWRASLRLQDMPTQCVAADEHRPDIVYCGTFGRGLWCSQDAGETWQPAGSGLLSPLVMSVAVSRLERNGDRGVVWAGTEPSALYRSEDGGGSWTECPSLRRLPSAPSWSFPPRPETSHVRWIVPDPHEPRRLVVGIELGGVMRTLDGGESWEDRKPGAQPDAHTLRMHPTAADRIYEAAGGGYAESQDGGASWSGYDEGLTRRYVWGLAVDPADPDTVVVSAAPGPGQAHNPRLAEAALYRRSGQSAWQEVRAGLPEPRGTRTYVLAASDAEGGVIYASTREAELFRSSDAGKTWQHLDVDWPDGYQGKDVGGLVVVDL